MIILNHISFFSYGQIHHFYRVCDLGKAIYDFIAEQSSEKEGCMQSCIFLFLFVSKTSFKVLKIFKPLVNHYAGFGKSAYNISPTVFVLSANGSD